MVADDGKRAVRMVASNQSVDLVLMDCHLPEMDGYEAAERIRIQEKLSGAECIPIIAISANSGSEHRKRCLDSGMNDVLVKPLQIALLRTVLWMWLPDVIQELPEKDEGGIQFEKDDSLWLSLIHI